MTLRDLITVVAKVAADAELVVDRVEEAPTEN
jgi:hypothetical protein